MSVYHKEKSDYLQQALESIWDNQTLKPDEIVLVEDGPLTTELYNVLSKWEHKLKKNTFKRVTLAKNMGLGHALAQGIIKCSNEIIARMDTDDISIPNRFKKQLEFLNSNPEISLSSSNIAEFIEATDKVVSIRKVPAKNQKIQSFAKKEIL